MTWGMVRDGEGQVTSLLSLPNSASKGKKGGREVSLCPELVESLRELHAWSPQPPRSDDAIFSERNQGMSAAAVAVRFKRVYDELGSRAVAVTQAAAPSSPVRRPTSSGTEARSVTCSRWRDTRASTRRSATSRATRMPSARSSIACRRVGRMV